MTFLFSPNDDTPEPCARPDLQADCLTTLRRNRQSLNRALDEIERMLQGQIAGDPSFTGPGCGVTLNLALNRLEMQADMIEAARPIAAPASPSQARPFGRRKAAELPAVVSVGSL